MQPGTLEPPLKLTEAQLSIEFVFLYDGIRLRHVLKIRKEQTSERTLVLKTYVPVCGNDTLISFKYSLHPLSLSLFFFICLSLSLFLSIFRSLGKCFSLSLSYTAFTSSLPNSTSSYLLQSLCIYLLFPIFLLCSAVETRRISAAKI